MPTSPHKGYPVDMRIVYLIDLVKNGYLWPETSLLRPGGTAWARATLLRSYC